MEICMSTLSLQKLFHMYSHHPLALDLAKKSDKKIKDKMDAYLVEGKLTRGRMQSNEFKSHYKQIVEKSGQLSMMIDTQVIMSIKIDLANQCV